MKLTGMVVAGVAAWVAAPWISMARRGTLDQQTVASWRAEPQRSRPAPHHADVPAQRDAAEDAPDCSASSHSFGPAV